jgi:hypothetical protein
MFEWIRYKLCRLITGLRIQFGKGGRTDDLHWHYRRGKPLDQPTPCPYDWSEDD